MYTNKDIQFRSIFVINCREHQKSLRVSNGELYLVDQETDKALTKIPFQKILAIFIIGNTTITSPLIEKCRRYNVAISLMKPSLRQVAFISEPAEANYLLRQRQCSINPDDITIAKRIVKNKISNQRALLRRSRKKDELTMSAIEYCDAALDTIDGIDDYKSMMGIEGSISKAFFAAYFDGLNWKKRVPRAHIDPINTMLDIGYTILFNFIEVFVRMFGFDLYLGVYHRQWFRRKSLICDLMEPFRCIVDAQLRKSFHLGQFKESDFKLKKGEYVLRDEEAWKYYQTYFETLITRKCEVFAYIQGYYRSFMKGPDSDGYPFFRF